MALRPYGFRKSIGVLLTPGWLWILTRMTISIDQQGIEALILLYGQLLFAPISGVGNAKNQMAPIINCLL